MGSPERSPARSVTLSRLCVCVCVVWAVPSGHLGGHEEGSHHAWHLVVLCASANEAGDGDAS